MADEVFEDVEPQIWNELYRTSQDLWSGEWIAPKLKSVLGSHLPQGGRVLEVGCGCGMLTAYLTGNGYEMTAIDLSADAIAQTANRLGDKFNGQLLVGNFFTHSFPIPFHAVVDRGVFHNMPGEEGRQRFAYRVAELLTASGIWIDISGSPEGVPLEINFGKLFLSHVVSAIEPYFVLLEVHSGAYGTTIQNHPINAWYVVAQRR